MTAAERIEKEAKAFAGSNYKKNHFPVHWGKAYEGYIAGATAAQELNRNELNKVLNLMELGWINCPLRSEAESIIEALIKKSQ